MPDVPTSPAQTVSSHAPKEFPWQPISKHGLESVASALPSLAEATRRAEPQSDTTSKVAPVPTGGAAAAPAPAKEVADPEIVPFESKPISPARPEADFEINSTSGRSRAGAPVFSSLSGIEAQQGTCAGQAATDSGKERFLQTNKVGSRASSSARPSEHRLSAQRSSPHQHRRRASACA